MRRTVWVAVLCAFHVACATAETKDDLPAPRRRTDAMIESGEPGADAGGDDSGAEPDARADAFEASADDATRPADASDGADDDRCLFGAVQSQPCGKCGSRSRSCTSAGTWAPWSTCFGERTGPAYCVPGEMRTVECGKCGTKSQACEPSTCTWSDGACLGEGVCAPGKVEVTSASCVVAGEVRTRECSSKCAWTPYSDCALPKGWLAMAKSPLSGRYLHTAIWTGAEMIVWGGYGTYVSPGYVRRDGAKYRLGTDTWEMLAEPPSSLSTGRNKHSAVWTGSAMIVWGGQDTRSAIKNDGASYDPSTDRWTSIAASTLSERHSHGAVWSTTTRAMIVWGGEGCPEGYCADGAAYDPEEDKWTALPKAPIAARSRASMVWTGTEVVIWGGSGAAGPLRDGARFDPKAKTWIKFPDPPVDIDARYDHASVFSGKELLVWGGYGTYLPALGTYARNTGGRYLAGGSWAAFVAPTEATLSRRFAPQAWYGASKLWVWGGASSRGFATGTAVPGGAWYDVSSDTWGAMDATGAPTARTRAAVVWTGKEAILWGGASNSSGYVFFADGGVYRP